MHGGMVVDRQEAEVAGELDACSQDRLSIKAAGRVE